MSNDAAVPLATRERPSTGSHDAPCRAVLARGWVSRRLIDFVLGIILIAGLLKASDVPAFARDLRTWSILPEVAAYPLALLVPGIEILIGLAWFLRIAPAAAAASAGGLLALFTAVFGAQVLFASPPACGCFGEIRLFYDGLSETQGVLLRNGVLLSALACAFALGRPRPIVSRQPLRPRGAAPGFTVLEALVVVGIVGVLVALLLPQLGRVRTAGQNAVSLSNLRGHVGVFAAYSNDWSDALPYVTRPDAPRTTLRCEARGVEVETRYFEAHTYWNYALADGYYNGDCFDGSFYPPAYPRGLEGATRKAGPTPYHYACVFLAAPEYWDPSSRTGPEQWRSTRSADIAFPSDKLMLVSYYPIDLMDSEVIYRDPRVSTDIAFADGSADLVRLDRINAGYPNGDGVHEATTHYLDFPFGLHTLGGIRGRDTMRGGH